MEVEQFFVVLKKMIADCEESDFREFEVVHIYDFIHHYLEDFK